jgi:hypothetical protein
MWPTSWGCDLAIVFPGGICFLWRIFLLYVDKNCEFIEFFFDTRDLGAQGPQRLGAEFLIDMDDGYGRDLIIYQ